MTLDFSGLLAALPSADETAAAQAANQVEEEEELPPAPKFAPLNAEALMADILEHKRKAELIQKSKKSKKVEKSKGYFGKVAAGDEARKNERKKVAPRNPKKGSRK
jgi:hypothetical protein